MGKAKHAGWILASQDYWQAEIVHILQTGECGASASIAIVAVGYPATSSATHCVSESIFLFPKASVPEGDGVGIRQKQMHQITMPTNNDGNAYLFLIGSFHPDSTRTVASGYSLDLRPREQNDTIILSRSKMLKCMYSLLFITHTAY